jgi:hypothetical protein
MDFMADLFGGTTVGCGDVACSPSRPELHVFYMLLLYLVTRPALASTFDVELFVPS